MAEEESDSSAPEPSGNESTPPVTPRAQAPPVDRALIIRPDGLFMSPQSGASAPEGIPAGGDFINQPPSDPSPRPVFMPGAGDEVVGDTFGGNVTWAQHGTPPSAVMPRQGIPTDDPGVPTSEVDPLQAHSDPVVVAGGAAETGVNVESRSSSSDAPLGNQIHGTSDDGKVTQPTGQDGSPASSVRLEGAAGSQSFAQGAFDILLSRPTAQDDEPTTKDRLGRRQLVRAIAALLGDPGQPTPLTIALFGDWGSGKTSIMKMLQDELQTNHAYRERFSFSWFNAWEYEHTDNMAAGLAQEVIDGLTDFDETEGWAWKRWGRRLWLGGRFACREHGWEVIKAVFTLAFLAFTFFTLGWLKDGAGKLVESLFGASMIVALYAFWAIFTQNFGTLVEHPAMAQLMTYVRLPRYGKHLGLLPVLRRHIRAFCELSLGPTRRLVLFVDDLDRCGPKAIVDTLTAIRLVMDVPNTIVIIGIDPKTAITAIGDHYKSVVTGTRTPTSIAREYLGKIVQLPIRVYPATDAHLESFAKSLLPMPEPPTPIPPSSSPPPEPEHFKHAMIHSEEERKAFADLAKRASMTNPRQLIRMRNSYRLLKVLDVLRNPERQPETLKLLPMLFWQEYILTQPEDKAELFVTAVEGKLDAEKRAELITSSKLAEVVLGSFNRDQAKVAASRVQIVMLPGSEG